MGVRGLRSYIREHQDKFLLDTKLKDTKLIIDGSNLLYFLYSHFEDENIYGGNYDHFSTRCRDFFHTLLKCNILPIVIFDGADDPDNMKLETTLKRLDERFRKVNKWQTTEEVLPILSEPLLYQILDELNVPHIATVYEADKEIAVLANRYDCPVLTNDSDFYVYNLIGGTISMACMVENERRDINGRFYLPVKLYRRDVVLRELFRMKNDDYIFPVFATLTGNDFFDPSSVILSHPKRPREKMSFARRNIRLIVEYICGADFESGTHAYEFICSQLTQEQKRQFVYSVDSYLDTKQFTLFDLKAVVDNLIDNRSNDVTNTEVIGETAKSSAETADHINENRSDDVMNVEENGITANSSVETDDQINENLGDDAMNIEENGKITKHSAENADHINENPGLESIFVYDKNGNKLPPWFLNAAVMCKVNCTFMLNITQNRRLLFKAQPESHELPSSFKCSEIIRRVIYRLLLNNGGSSGRNKQSLIIQEFHRQSTDLSKMKPIETLEFISELPNLETIPLLPRSERKAIVYATFKAKVTSFGDELDETSQILILILKHWIRSSKATEFYVNAVLVGVIGLHILNETAPIKCKDILNAIEETEADTIKNFKQRFEKYFKRQDFMERHGINKVFIHRVSQFQTIFLYTHHLNKLLLSPVSMPCPSIVLHSTFDYNMCHLLENNVCLRNIFPGEGSPLYCLLRKWQRIIDDLVFPSSEGKKGK